MIKKLTFFVSLFFVFSVLSVYAQQGGFTGSAADASTVAQALTFRDDAPVILKGHILRSLGNEKYLFSDDTGTITVEIERKTWRTISVNEKDLVEISGEIDRDRRSIEVEVKSIRKLQQ
jgi:uncharacterized protein (TIGR00156 family)